LATNDSVNKAVKREKKRLKEHAELKKKIKEPEIESFNAPPSRVKVDAGKELIIEPRPLLSNIFEYITSHDNLGKLGLTIGLCYAYLALFHTGDLVYIAIRLGISISENMITTGAYLFLFICVVRLYVVGVIRQISRLNEPFHLKVSGKNFMIHGRNPEEHLAAAAKRDSDGEWNLMAEITEEKGNVSFNWVYGPDINISVTGGNEFYKLNLNDIELIRTFLKDNKIEIASDIRINE